MGALDTFPLSYKVGGRRIVIVGGGEEALNKARLAVRTRAAVVVVSPTFSADFSGLDVELNARPVVAADLDGAALVFIADHGPDGAAALDVARMRKIPANVVDRPESCDFYTPSIVDRAPLTVAISSEGAAPVLTRLVRARIEAQLAPDLGRLAALMGRMRASAARLLPDGRARRRYFEALAGGDGIGSLAEAEALLAAHASGGQGAGIVHLIGAGPGAEDLLTLRAQRLLQQADVIVHDQLVPAAVIEMGRRDAIRLPVGKARGHHSFTQAQINALLVRLAGEGKRVARLKSGDPLVFGRAGEELAALRRAGIACEVVPGVSAALAAAADTATPVTLRDVSPGLVLATAHGAGGEPLHHWAALARAGMTLALYMGKAIAGEVAARLVAEGLAPATPVGIVVNAGRRDRSSYRGRLGELAAGEVEFAEGPAVILIGAAVRAGDWADAAALAARQTEAA
jgi:uroporphyrin-III C-methyltransferase/precorrin-2 dehydrogenase/sirohydrochlorin ferrochelatase